MGAGSWGAVLVGAGPESGLAGVADFAADAVLVGLAALDLAAERMLVLGDDVPVGRHVRHGAAGADPGRHGRSEGTGDGGQGTGLAAAAEEASLGRRGGCRGEARGARREHSGGPLRRCDRRGYIRLVCRGTGSRGSAWRRGRRRRGSGGRIRGSGRHDAIRKRRCSVARDLPLVDRLRSDAEQYCQRSREALQRKELQSAHEDLGPRCGR
jgi:hypothetical protein